MFSLAPLDLTRMTITYYNNISRAHFLILYLGILACLDGFMNIAMEQTEEYENGLLKAQYGDCFIRGNNVLYISTAKSKK